MKLKIRVMIIGATGFVGRALVECLLVRGVKVLAAVRKKSASLPSVVQQVVINDLQLLAEGWVSLPPAFFDDVDVITYLAARVQTRGRGQVPNCELSVFLVYEKTSTARISKCSVSHCLSG